MIKHTIKKKQYFYESKGKIEKTLYEIYLGKSYFTDSEKQFEHCRQLCIYKNRRENSESREIQFDKETASFIEKILKLEDISVWTYGGFYFQYQGIPFTFGYDDNYRPILCSNGSFYYSFEEMIKEEYREPVEELCCTERVVPSVGKNSPTSKSLKIWIFLKKIFRFLILGYYDFLRPKNYAKSMGYYILLEPMQGDSFKQLCLINKIFVVILYILLYSVLLLTLFAVFYIIFMGVDLSIGCKVRQLVGIITTGVAASLSLYIPFYGILETKENEK